MPTKKSKLRDLKPSLRPARKRKPIKREEVQTNRAIPPSLLRIDRHRLDEEIEDHPERVFQYGEALAHSKLALEQAKHTLTVLEAEKSQWIRSNWGECAADHFGDSTTRMSEDKVKIILTSDEDIIAQQRRVARLKEEEGRAFAVLEALRAKTGLLNSLVSLYSAQYWSDRPDRSTTRRR